MQATTDLTRSINWLGITQGIAASGGLNSFLTNSSGQNSLFFRLTRACATNDLPDALFADDNCDGIDGDISAAVFVAPNGVDNPAGGTMQSPFRTITYAVQRAQTTGKNQVLIQAGTYSESVNLANGIGLYGGYDVNWVRGPHTLPGHAVTIQGGFNSTQQQFITLCASDTQTNEITDLELVGPTATTNGLSSYAVYVRQSSLMFNRVTITAGAGAAGQTGADGLDAEQTDAQSGMNGGDGGNAAQYSISCDSTSRGAGGSAGINGPSLQGGVGGAGGTMDTSCITNIFGGILCSDCSATPGQNGGDADGVVAPYGQGGFGGNASGGPAQPGQYGVVSNGSAGSNGNGYQLDGNFFFAHSGSAGGIGQNGGGGGGGGGSGGNDSGTDSYGAGGGGGGAGGLAARGGGSGGQGGGGSFGIFAVNSSVGLTNSTITLGSGGNGGAGGAGGRGQSGGQGGFGGAAAGSSPVGGNGGHGGHGGHGGGGGGGQGGYCVGIAYYISTLGTNSVIFSGGAAGLGGQGGAAAPTAPAGEQDGNAGQVGFAGILTNVLSLSLSVP